MATNFYGAIALIGGGTGALDKIDGTDLANGDGALVITAANFYIFYLNASSGAGESSPDIISPDTNAGNKRWILTELGNIASTMHGVNTKTTPVNADELGLIDSAASWVLKKLTWSNLKATLKSYFDTIYAALAHKTRHENAGADKINVTGLSGLLADDQHVLDSEVLAAAGENIGITSMTGLNDDGIPLAKVANAASDGANSDITSLDALTGGQIAFPATAVPSANANTLDDYEEGSWTPDLQFGDAKVDITYNNQVGWYTKIGRLVSVSAHVSLTSKGSSVGNATIEGLPFTASAGKHSTLSGRMVTITFANVFQGYAAGGTTSIKLEELTEAGVRTEINNTNFADTSSVIFSATYII